MRSTGVGFKIAEGEVYGLLGPNGAGKTTTMKMVCGLLEPDKGTISIAGQQAIGNLEVKALIGYVPQDVALYPDLTARENLAFLARLYKLGRRTVASRVDEALELTDLADRRDDRLDSFSGGMKRRLNIAAGLLNHPKLLVLDEPTVGVDPQSRHAILERVQAFGREGLAVVYTTHYMEEAERVCDRVGHHRPRSPDRGRGRGASWSPSSASRTASSSAPQGTSNASPRRAARVDGCQQRRHRRELRPPRRHRGPPPACRPSWRQPTPRASRSRASTSSSPTSRPSSCISRAPRYASEAGVRTALAIARKDLRQRIRDRSAIVVGVIAPVVIAGLMSLAFNGVNSFHFTLGVVELDHGPVAAQLVKALERSSAEAGHHRAAGSARRHSPYRRLSTASWARR